MSVKKILVLSAAAFVAMGATAAMAGGPDHMAMPSEPAFQNNVYIEGHFGGTLANWTDFNSNNVIGNAGTSYFAPSSNGKGSWVGGADLGYSITQNIAVEGGWFYIPQVSANGTGATPGTAASQLGQTAKVDSWFAYAAAKFTVPVVSTFDLFGKVGVAYRSLSYTVPAAITAMTGSVAGNGGYWAPVFGAGAQYGWGAWILGFQYMYLPGNSAVNYGNTSFGAPNAAPELNQFTGSLGYKFDV
ncbi:MAG TPA: hypothetical protein VJK30_02585 [Coxiellaceae bacterium]|nr:MAG: hypothetical protein A3E81_02585 [Gammaproteobacteria bacterium RIFCSPHIGHO2_12_FULL_36_30]HLB56201.1 hypothetical protein [Coxiellaceae bacterium]